MPLPPQPATAVPGSSSSASDFIKSALRLCKVLAAGDSPGGDDLQDGLVVLNQMMDGWNAERLMIFTVAITDFPLTPSKSSYTLGTGGDFNLQRPARLSRASIVLLNNPSQPLERPLHMYLNEKEWQGVSIKSIPSTFPLAFYDDGGFPFRTLTFWPIPLENDTFRLYSWQPLTTFADLKTKYAFPPGYAEAIRYNLALRVADEWGGELGPTIVTGAAATVSRIKTFNVPLVKLGCDEAMVGGADPGITNYRSELFNIP